VPRHHHQSGRSQRTRRSRQAWDELVIVKEGTVEAQIDGKPHHFAQGSVLFQAANDLHGVKNVGDKPATTT